MAGVTVRLLILSKGFTTSMTFSSAEATCRIGMPIIKVFVMNFRWVFKSQELALQHLLESWITSKKWFLMIDLEQVDCCVKEVGDLMECLTAIRGSLVMKIVMNTYKSFYYK